MKYAGRMTASRREFLTRISAGAAMCAAPGAPSGAERQFAECKVYDAQGSPLRAPREDWDGARQRIAADAGWQSWLGAQRAEVDDWMAKRRDRVEWVAGWWHDFVSPKDGSFLTWMPDEPGEFTLASPSDPRVELTPKIHGGWVFGFRSRHASKVEEAAALWKLTREDRYASWAADQLDFYADHYAEWPLQTVHSPARLMHQSLDEAVNLLKYVRAARWLEGFVPAGRKRGWIERLFLPEAAILGQSFQRIHNIACWQRAAQGSVALYAGDEELWRLAADGEFGMRAQMRKGITADFLWLEQSLLYNNYVVTAVTPFFLEAALAGRGGSLREEMARAQNLLLAPIYLRFPDGKLPTPADSTGGFAHAPNRAALAAAYRVFPTAIGLEEAGRQRTLSTLIDPPGPAPQAVIPEVRSWHLEASRMMLLRRGPWQVYFHYGQIDPSHAQAEALQYEAYFESTDVTHDTGTVGYGSPLHRGFYTTGWAHNVPMIDGLGQEKWQPGEALAWRPEEGRMAAAQPVYRSNARCERTLEVVGAALHDRLSIRTTDGQPHRLGALLHLQGRIGVPGEFTPIESPVPFGKDARAGSPSQAVEFPVRLGDRSFRLRIRAGRAFRAVHLVTPDAPPKLRETVYCEIASASEASFETVIEPLSASPSSRD